MELKPGYKQTGAGVLPEDWKVECLEDVGTVIDGDRGANYPSERDFYNSEFCLFLNAGNVTKNGFRFHDCTFINRKRDKLLRKGKLKRYDIVLTTRGTVGNIAYFDNAVSYENIRINSGMVILRGNTNAFRPSFLNFLMQSNLVVTQFERLTFGSAQPQLTVSGIQKILLPLPHFVEQDAINTVLSDVNSLLLVQDELIAKKRDIKQAVMQQLLTGKQRLPGFSGAWELKQLGEMGYTYGGLTGKTKTDFGYGSAHYIPFLNVIANVRIDVSNLVRVNVSATEMQNAVRKGDLFFNGSSETPEEVGLCSLLTENLGNTYLNSFCFGFRAFDGIEFSGLYFAYFFRSQQGRELLYSLAQGATRYNLSKTALLRCSFKVPLLEEQEAIATLLSNMDAEIIALEQKRDKTRAIKQGMMQELLTGRTRLL